MPTEPEQTSPKPGETEEKQLCVSCVFPNDPEAHFCAKCGAPLTSYAATGPFERIFAEGHLYRQAAERPSRLIVVIGIWIIFGAIGLTGILFVASDRGPALVFIAVLMLAVSLAMIAKTTRNYFSGTRSDEKRDADA